MYVRNATSESRHNVRGFFKLPLSSCSISDNAGTLFPHNKLSQSGDGRILLSVKKKNGTVSFFLVYSLIEDEFIHFSY